MAMIESHFCMNVARATGRERFGGGPEFRHYCRIELGPLLTSEARAMAADIRPRFPAPEFKLTLTRVECVGREEPF